jgi:hypothetical protein
MNESDPLVQLAIELKKLGVSDTRIVELLSKHTQEEIRNQLDWLPYRRASRPEAFVIEAIRKGYGAPKEIYASRHPKSEAPGAVDKDSQPPY